MGETATELLIPGFRDSILAVKKPVSDFGILAAQLDSALVDADGAVVIAVARVLKRLEPLRPYVYLGAFGRGFELVRAAPILIPDLRLRTRPYSPLVVDFTVVNPASTPFDCEVTLGPDLIAPSVVRVPPQSKVAAQFALNPDRSGDIESFIQFHDAQMRLIVTSFGPDVSIRCPFIRQAHNLSDAQGMVAFQSRGKQPGPQVQSWERLLEDVPRALTVLPLEAQDLKMDVQGGG